MEIAAKIELRNLRFADFLELNEAVTEAYAGIGGEAWDKGQIRRLLEIFPEGQLCIAVDGKVVAGALSIIIDYQQHGNDHTYEEIVDDYRFGTHNPKGDVLYGIDVFVHPDYRGMRLGRRLYDARKELCEQLNLRAIMAGGRIPNYNQYAPEMTPRQYIEKVKLREIHDPVLSFQLSNDFHVKKIMTGYLEGDHESREYATLLEWNNIYYQEKVKLINAVKEYVRIGIVQWQMRPFPNVEALLVQAEYFVDAVSDYQSDFILFPELFNAPLMAEFNQLGSAKAIRELAQYTAVIRDQLLELAMNYNVNIIAGSMPEVGEDGHVYNTSYLCRRDGTSEVTRKIHITPSERDSWGMMGGDRIQVFNTDAGRIGILICYDVEFPELARIYADQGMDILFVPFLTDTQNGYNRVRLCAQARAIENECFVVIAGCVGNLPKVNNMDLQFAQSAIFTPSDFPFPLTAIQTEATPNTEMVLVGDVDLSLLKELHEYGSVRNLKDRRRDLYQIQVKPKAITDGTKL